MTTSISVFRGGRQLLVGASLLVSAWACASVPAYLGMSAEELWEAGVQAYDEENWDDAIQMLERLVIQNPGHPRGPEARMYIARAFVARGKYITAASEFERFLQLHRNDGLAPEASLGVCRAYAALAPHPQRDQSYTQQAEEACGQTWLEFRGLTVAETADSIRVEMLNRLAESDYEEAEFYRNFDMHNSAIMIFEDVVSRYPETNWAPRGLLGIYHSYVSLGWVPEAEEASARLLAEYPESEPARQLRAEMGEGDESTREAGVDR